MALNQKECIKVEYQDFKLNLDIWKNIVSDRYGTIDIKIFDYITPEIINEAVKQIHNYLHDKSKFDIQIVNILVNNENMNIYLFKLIDCLQVNKIRCTISNNFTTIEMSKL